MAAKIPAIETLSKEVQALYDVVNEEPDLPCVLVSTSFLDQCLASLLERHFIKSNTAKSMLDPRGGSLGTFSARADLCYCLGLIPKGLFQNLRTIGEIRNRFAHSYLSLSFDESEIRKFCESLTLPGAVRKLIKDATGESEEMVNFWATLTNPRARFTVCVAMMANRLLLTGLATERRARKEKGWN